MAENVRKKSEAALLAALANGATIADSAAKSGYSERTVYRKLKDAAFRQQLTGARAALVDQAVGVLSKASAFAAATLFSLMTGKERTDSIKLHAARAVLEYVAKLRENVALEERLAELERRLLEREKP
jgi:hypothetical protein